MCYCSCDFGYQMDLLFHIIKKYTFCDKFGHVLNLGQDVEFSEVMIEAVFKQQLYAALFFLFTTGIISS